MPPSDQEPRYQLVDSNGNVVGSLFGDGSGNVVIADETDTQTTFGPDGITTPALEATRSHTTRESPIVIGSVGAQQDFNGADADARLDNAISAASNGDCIFLEATTYTANRTLSNAYNFVGVHPDSTVINATWTVNGTTTTFHSIGIDGLLDIDGIRSVVKGCLGSGTADKSVVFGANRCRIIDCDNIKAIYEGGTTQGVANMLSLANVVDNGTNTIGGEIT